MTVSREIFDYLLDHMLDIHQRKINIVSPYSLDYDQYMSMLEFLNSYIRKIGDFLDVAVVDDDCKSALPFVVLGSLVYTEGMGLYERDTYSIVLPEETQDMSHNSAIKVYTCLSPVSHALLFKKAGDKVALEEDGRFHHCTIKRIDLC